jgi:hypothetical protein
MEEFDSNYIQKYGNQINKIDIDLECLERDNYICKHHVKILLYDNSIWSNKLLATSTELLEFYYLMDNIQKKHFMENLSVGSIDYNKNILVKVLNRLETAIQIKDTRITKLEEEIIHLKYMPDGIGYKEAKENFEKLANL